MEESLTLGTVYPGAEKAQATGWGWYSTERRPQKGKRARAKGIGQEANEILDNGSRPEGAETLREKKRSQGGQRWDRERREAPPGGW